MMRLVVIHLLSIPFISAFIQIELSTPSPAYELSWESCSSIHDCSLLLSLNTIGSNLHNGFQNDVVVRVLDANTIKLKKNGLVSLAAVKTPTVGNYKFPECLSYSPDFKIKQLLPKDSNIQVKLIGTQAIIIKENGLLVNEELVRTGFAKRRGGGLQDVAELDHRLSNDSLSKLEERAKANGLGIYKKCDSDTLPQAEFEELELTVQTQWGADGGKPVLRKKEDFTTTQPVNPGDTKGCSDFESYEDALRWYERYYPWYGDVARLDRNSDGIPCPGLPHTTSRERYRMKIPQTPPCKTDTCQQQQQRQKE